MITRGERGIWQRRYWEHTIRDERDFAAHMDYTHFNPVKHGRAEHPADWPHSSFRRCLASGLYPAGWVAAANHKGPASGGETETAEANAPERQESAAFSAHSPSGLLPAHLCSGRTSAGDGWWRNALRFSALRGSRYCAELSPRVMKAEAGGCLRTPDTEMGRALDEIFSTRAPLAEKASPRWTACGGAPDDCRVGLGRRHPTRRGCA